MKADDATCWDFTGPLIDTSEVRCRDCGEWSPLSEWREGEVPCDECGSHAAMVCPRCGEGEDHVWSVYHPMEVRTVEASPYRTTE